MDSLDMFSNPLLSIAFGIVLLVLTGRAIKRD